MKAIAEAELTQLDSGYLSDLRVHQLLGLTLQLALAVFLIGQFQLESRALFVVGQLILAGFVVHSVLPVSMRLSCFGALSAASLLIVFGVRQGATMIFVGLVLIAVCHIRAALWIRVLVIMCLGGALALSRTGALWSPWSSAVWPIIGSMFMFRLAVYLYALKYEETKPSIEKAFSYFFMVPSVCFPLFPVVDYTTMYRMYYKHDSYDTYQRGVQWILRGMVHLMLYRIVYRFFTTDPSQIHTARDLMQHLLSTFLLYLRVSGQFHMIVGVLHLFGFRLPETHRLYYLASSFTDFWRRINIYWKDFMMKMFYYPTFFRIRRWGNTVALVVSTLVVFLATWVLHSYQWFWLRGGFPISLQDMLFWGILGIIVVMSALREKSQGRKAALTKEKGWSIRRAMRVGRTFTTICILWSLWSAESVGEWLGMWSAALRLGALDVAVIGTIVLIGLLVAGRSWDSARVEQPRKRILHYQPAVQSLVILSLFFVFGQTKLYGERQPQLAAMINSLKASTLNARDAELQHKGYYEKLDNVSRMSDQLWELQAERPADWIAFKWSEASRKREDFLVEDIEPSIQTTLWGQPFRSNRWGMRDREYSEEKASDVVRLAILGPSFVMGLGVADGESFEALFEDRLNGASSDDHQTRYEVLNFGVGAYSLLQQMAMLEDRGLAFDPDVVIVAIPEDKRVEQALVNHLTEVISRGTAIPYSELTDILASNGIEFEGTHQMSGVKIVLRKIAKRLNIRIGDSQVERDLRKASWQTAEWSLERIARLSRENGAVPVALGLDIVRGRSPDGDKVFKLAGSRGFVPLDLFDVYDGRDPIELRLGEWDEHPNAIGHQLIAERLFTELNAQTLLNLIHPEISSKELIVKTSEEAM